MVERLDEQTRRLAVRVLVPWRLLVIAGCSARDNCWFKAVFMTATHYIRYCTYRVLENSRSPCNPQDIILFVQGTTLTYFLHCSDLVTYLNNIVYDCWKVIWNCYKLLNFILFHFSLKSVCSFKSSNMQWSPTVVFRTGICNICLWFWML